MIGFQGDLIHLLFIIELVMNWSRQYLDLRIKGPDSLTFSGPQDQPRASSGEWSFNVWVANKMFPLVQDFDYLVVLIQQKNFIMMVKVIRFLVYYLVHKMCTYDWFLTPIRTSKSWTSEHLEKKISWSLGVLRMKKVNKISKAELKSRHWVDFSSTIVSVCIQPLY